MTCATVGFHSTSIRKLTGQILFSLFSCYYDNSFSYCFDNGIYEYFSSRTIIDYEYRSLFSLIFRAPETSYLPWHIVFGQPHWRQEFVFAMIPILFQEVWRARQSAPDKVVGGDNTTVPLCTEMALRDEESFPFPAWTPKITSMEAKPKAYRLVG